MKVNRTVEVMRKVLTDREEIYSEGVQKRARHSRASQDVCPAGGGCIASGDHLQVSVLGSRAALGRKGV